MSEANNRSNRQRSRPRRSLIVVDMSVEQVADVSYLREPMVEHCRALLSSRPCFDLVVDCRLWLRSVSESSLAKVWPATATTLFVADSEGASLIPDLRNVAPHMVFVEKNNYSCFAHTRLLSALQEANIQEVFICGINTDYCIFATALDAFQHHFDTFVVEDAVSSNGGKAAHEEGLRNLQKHFGPKVFIKTEELLSQHGIRQPETS